MKTLKISIALILFLIIGLFTIAEINYQEAVRSARQVETDGEIQAILQEHGFNLGIYDEIGPKEKVQAVFNRLSNN